MNRLAQILQPMLEEQPGYIRATTVEDDVRTVTIQFGNVLIVAKVLHVATIEQEEMAMEPRDLIRNLEHEYHAIRAANPTWEKSLWDFLVEKGCDPDDIWSYSSQIGYAANQPEPQWI